MRCTGVMQKPTLPHATRLNLLPAVRTSRGELNSTAPSRAALLGGAGNATAVLQAAHQSVDEVLTSSSAHNYQRPPSYQAKLHHADTAIIMPDDPIPFVDEPTSDDDSPDQYGHFNYINSHSKIDPDPTYMRVQK